MKSTNDVLRKYLDILNEAEAAKPADPAQLDTPPADSQSSGDPLEMTAQKIITAVKEYQKLIMSVAGKFPPNAPERKVKVTGMIDPATLVAIYSHGGKGLAGADKTVQDLSTPSDAKAAVTEDEMMGGAMPAPAPSAPPMTETIQDTIRRKAALHEGYACGLMAESHHKCVHPEGSHEHLHWHHGYSKGLAECSGVWRPKGTF
jgi:hypothetical protein